jgi:TPR repeat protein
VNSFLEIDVKFVFVMAGAVLLSMLLAPGSFAAKIEELELKRFEADQFYAENDYKNAYKAYYKLAKAGDHYSQSKVSGMYVSGKGRNVDLAEAYAWSVLAAEGGSQDLLDESSALLERNADKADAEKKASKLVKKYGEVALKKKADNRARTEARKSRGSCTGSRMGCSGP